jgi:hypothetical protein
VKAASASTTKTPEVLSDMPAKSLTTQKIAPVQEIKSQSKSPEAEPIGGDPSQKKKKKRNKNKNKKKSADEKNLQVFEQYINYQEVQ